MDHKPLAITNYMYMFHAIWEFAQSQDCLAHSQNPEIAFYYTVMYSWPASVCWLQEVPRELHWPMTVYICSWWFDCQEYHIMPSTWNKMYHVMCSLCQNGKQLRHCSGCRYDYCWSCTATEWAEPTTITQVPVSQRLILVCWQLVTAGKTGSLNRPRTWQMIIFISVTSSCFSYVLEALVLCLYTD